MVLCAAYKCTSRTERKEPGVTFHRFPKHEVLRQEWVDNMKLKDWYPSHNHRLCSKHFEEKCFDRTKPKVKLYPEAVPTIFHELPKYLQPQTAKKRPHECLPPTSDPDAPSTSGLQTQTSPDPDTPRKKRLKRTLLMERVKSRGKTRKIRVLSQALKRSKKKIISLKHCVKLLEEKNLLSLEDCTLLQNISGVTKELLQRKVGKKNKYSPALRKFAVTLNFFSPKAYDYVREVFDTCLPHKSTIGKWYKNVNAEPGFSTECLNTLKNHVESSSKSTIVSLIIDEIAIRKHLEWDGKKFHGYVNFGVDFNDDSSSLAREAFVLMVVCINGTWKIPIGYFFSDGLSGHQKASIVTQAIRLIIETGAKVKALTCDGAPSNITMATLLGCSLSPPNISTTFSVALNEIHFFLDPCHMIKLIRNTLGEKKILIDPEGKLINWEFIAVLQDLQESEGLHLGNKLRRAHVNFFKQKMKVRLAVQVLSRSVADSLEYCQNILSLSSFQGCEGTVSFIRIANDCFDLLNSRSLVPPGFKKALCASNFERSVQFVQSSIRYFSNLKLSDNTLLINSGRKTGFVGMIVSLTSALKLYSDIIVSGTLIYLPLYKVSQDHLELFFSSIRSRGGWNNNPTCRQFTGAYKRLLVRAEIREGGLGNCLPLEQISILVASSRMPSRPEDVINSSTPLASDSTPEEENLDIVLQDHSYIANELVMSEFSEQIIIYIAGFVVRKLQKCIKCESCVAALIGDKENFLYSLITQKSHGGLTYPSKNVIKICRKAEMHLRTYLTDIHKKNFALMACNKIVTYFLDCNIFENLNNHVLDNEVNHIYFLIRSIVIAYIDIRMHFISKMRSQQPDTSRSQLTKLILFRGQ